MLKPVASEAGSRTVVPATVVAPPANTASIAGPKPPQRLVYPFSIVPGGVRSRAELKAAMQADRLVAAHYAGVDVDGLHPVTLARDLAAYVSFQKNGKVYWTSRKVRLAKGERVFQAGTPGLTPGVRERCGNQVSEQPRTPVLPDIRNEPTGPILDTPVGQMATPAEIASASADLVAALGPAAAVESASPQIPVGAGPIVFQGGGGGGGVFAGGGVGGGGGGGGGAASPGQTGGILPPTEFARPGAPEATGIVLPGALPIDDTRIAGPNGAGPKGSNLISYTLPLTQIVPPGVSFVTPAPVRPAFHTCCQVLPTPPTVPGGTPEVVLVVPPSVPPVIVTGVPPDITPVTPPLTSTTPLPTTAVPEPSTWIMLGTGLVLVLIGSRSRKPRK